MAVRGVLPDADRLKRLRDAARRAKPTSEITMAALEGICGLSRSVMSRHKDMCPNFPRARRGAQNMLLFAAKPALKALIDYELREQRMAAEQARDERRILGKRSSVLVKPGMSLEQLAKLSRIAADLEARERAQGEYVATSEMRRVLGNVLAIVSTTLSNLETAVDPNALMPVSERLRLHTVGQDVLLKLYAETKDMLEGNVRNPPTRRTRGRPRRSLV